MPISHEFQFNTVVSQRNDVHPMELAVQAVVGDSLDALATQLQTLHESQVVLIARLKVIEEKLKRWETQTELTVDVKVMCDRLLDAKKRLKVVLVKLEVIEQRIKRQASGNQSKGR